MERLNSYLFCLVLFILPVLKIIETYRRPVPLSIQNVDLKELSTNEVAKLLIDLKSPSANEEVKLGVDDVQQWTWEDQVGYGLLRRLDDLSYWLLIGLLLAHRYIFQLKTPDDWDSRTVPLGVIALFGLLFATVYIWNVSVEHGTFFSPTRITGWKYWGIQVPEGIINSLVHFVSGIFVYLYYQFVRELPVTGVQREIVERVRVVGYTPLQHYSGPPSSSWKLMSGSQHVFGHPIWKWCHEKFVFARRRMYFLNCCQAFLGESARQQNQGWPQMSMHVRHLTANNPAPATQYDGL